MKNESGCVQGKWIGWGGEGTYIWAAKSQDLGLQVAICCLEKTPHGAVKLSELQHQDKELMHMVLGFWGSTYAPLTVTSAVSQRQHVVLLGRSGETGCYPASHSMASPIPGTHPWGGRNRSPKGKTAGRWLWGKTPHHALTGRCWGGEGALGLEMWHVGATDLWSEKKGRHLARPTPKRSSG